MKLKADSSLRHWLAVSRAPGIGPRRFRELLDANEKLVGIPDCIQPDWTGADQDLEWMIARSQRAILTLDDPRYPSLLKAIHDPPPLLYVEGDVSALQQPQLAMVGSRSPTAQGIRNAEKFAMALANEAVWVTSGLAYGIDAASHQGALKAEQGGTVAVLAHGLDLIYPRQHERLYEQILIKGAVISEFPIGTRPQPGFFPRRNRLISGLSLGVLVIEAAEKSGSLITARCALEQGREVFAIPGGIHSLKSRGCHTLIQQGAKLVYRMEDIWEELDHLLNRTQRGKKSTQWRALREGSPEARVEQLLRERPEVSTLEALAMEAKQTPREAAISLSKLELMGAVCRVPGGYLGSF